MYRVNAVDLIAKLEQFLFLPYTCVTVKRTKIMPQGRNVMEF